MGCDKYYEVSGERAKDQKRYQAAYLVCYSIFYPKAEECLRLQNCAGNGYFANAAMIPFCAETLADVPPGEFNNLDFGGMWWRKPVLVVSRGILS